MGHSGVSVTKARPLRARSAQRRLETTVKPSLPARSRLALRTVAAVGLTAVLLVSSIGGGWSAPPAPHPVAPSLRHAAMSAPSTAAGARTTAASRSLSASSEVPSGVAVVGVTWERGSVRPGDTVQVRVLDSHGWGPWQDLEHDGDHGPDADRPEGPDRVGTAPVVVTEGKRVEARIVASGGSGAKGARLDVIDPGTSNADASVGAARPGAASAAASRPTIHSRAEWGADESLRKEGPAYGTLQLAFVHHTDGTNSYTSAQVPSIIRGIYAYHVKGQGWNDIGYNFLVDRFGRIWEGRYGGVDRPVVGAQTANYNSWSTGVAVLGNFQSTTPPAAATRAVSSVLAWKFTLAGIPATGTVVAGDKTFNRISGHRDGYPTSCPGARLYAALPGIRSSVKSLMGSMSSTAVSRDSDHNGQPDLVTYTPQADGSTGPLTLLKAASLSPVRSWRKLGTGWNGLRLMTTTPDVTGDGHPDIVAVDSTGTLRIYHGDGRGGLPKRSTAGKGWGILRELAAAGDRTGDGRADLLGLTTSGELRLWAGNGAGGFATSRVIGTGWSAYRQLLSMGDVEGDGLPDLLATNGKTGEQRRWPGVAGGGVGTSVLWGRSMGSYTATIGGGDYDGNGHPDMIVRGPAGMMRIYYAGAGGKWERWSTFGSGWQGIDHVSGGVDFDGDGRPDIVGVNPAADRGALLLYAGTGQRDLQTTAALPDVPGADLARLVGDVDGDGWADLLVRVPARRSVELLRGTGRGTFAAPVLMGTGWNEFTMIEPLGDLNRDGVPDLGARTSSGQVWVYPMTRTMKFKARYLIAQGFGTMLSLAGVGNVNSDYNGDVVGLTSAHDLVLYRGGGNGAVLRDVVTLRSSQKDLVQVLGVNDFNGDGKRDIMARAANGRLWLYAGTGTGDVEATRQAVLWNQGATNVIG